MNKTSRRLILYSTLIIIGLCAFFWGVSAAKSFLAPVLVSVLLAMLVLPLCKWLEKKGMKRGWAALLGVLSVLLVSVALVGVLGLQIRSFTSDWPQIKERMEPKIKQLQQVVEKRTGLTVQEQNEKIGLGMLTDGASAEGSPQEQESEQAGQNDGQQNMQEEEQAASQSSGSSGGSMASRVGTFVMGVLGFLGTYLLVLIYIFFFLLYRSRFSGTILRLVPQEKRREAGTVVSDAADVSQNYLVGRLILIACLAVLYSIGLSISGVKHALLISVLAAFLSLLPYVGNAVGFVLAISMALLSGSGAMGALGVVITFAVAQFVESYVLEPYVVGDKVDLNPIMVILVVVLGEAVWGLAGMVIAIPVLGILKVVCDHVPVLHPFAYLMGQEGQKK